MGTFYTAQDFDPFHFTHPTDRDPDEGYAYVLETSTGVVKVGYTAYPDQRVPIHVAAAHADGAKVIAAWISDPHANARNTERQVLAYCRESGGDEIATEHFVGVDFCEVVEVADAVEKRRRTESDGVSVRFLPGAVTSLRRANGWKVKAFAERVEISGGFLSKIERNVQNPSGHIMRRIADALGVPLAALTVDRDAFNRALRNALSGPLSSSSDAPASVGGSGRRSVPRYVGRRPTSYARPVGVFRP